MTWVFSVNGVEKARWEGDLSWSAGMPAIAKKHLLYPADYSKVTTTDEPFIYGCNGVCELRLEENEADSPSLGLSPTTQG